MKNTLLLLSITLLIATTSCSKLERYEKKFADAMLGDNYEEVYKAYGEFCEWLMTDSATMTYDFPVMHEKLGMKIQSSPDGKLRCYSWVTNQEDTISSYSNVIQWKDGEKMVAFNGPLDAMLTGRKPKVSRQWSLAHSIDTIFQIDGKKDPIYLIVQSYVNELGYSFSYVSAALNMGAALKILPFFFDGIETAGNRQFINDGKVNMQELIKWDGKKLYAYLTDDNERVISGKYETYTLGEQQFTKDVTE